MHAKTCPACGQVSFSANTLPPWLCPYCHQDLSQLPLEPATKSKLSRDEQQKEPFSNISSANNLSQLA